MCHTVLELNNENFLYQGSIIQALDKDNPLS